MFINNIGDKCPGESNAVLFVVRLLVTPDRHVEWLAQGGSYFGFTLQSATLQLVYSETT